MGLERQQGDVVQIISPEYLEHGVRRHRHRNRPCRLKLKG